jgi:hypothetical protein
MAMVLTRYLQLHLLLTEQLYYCVKKNKGEQDAQPRGRLQLAYSLVSMMTVALNFQTTSFVKNASDGRRIISCGSRKTVSSGLPRDTLVELITVVGSIQLL